MKIMMGLALFAVLAALLARPGSAQSTSGCTQVLMTMTPCLNYVTGNSSAPSATCCSSLGSIVQSRPQCLCLLLNGAMSSAGYNINQTLALALPGACNVKTPSASICNALSPSGAPTTSPPADSNTPSAPAASSTPTLPSGSKTTPTTTSGSKSIGVSLGSLLFALILALFGSNLFKF
ncbi:non-specific lipid transfer protein GPI-anchored 19 isoform X2 [Eucalyptus grandis]|uniref:non-specific lipid transfer protein GPI-anchored 19 isoform X2 n=1 Tax=Eucalyptus grandis TaxID=71139 RepID=UPI00192EF86E|nr:non-specific lipid transfer protein GPI-anchored 19 isoform X2 [Eucalyptus grandis]